MLKPLEHLKIKSIGIDISKQVVENKISNEDIVVEQQTQTEKNIKTEEKSKTLPEKNKKKEEKK